MFIVLFSLTLAIHVLLFFFTEEHHHNALHRRLNRPSGNVDIDKHRAVAQILILFSFIVSLVLLQVFY